MLSNSFEAKTVETAEIAQPAKCENCYFLYLLKSILKLQTIQNFKILSVNIKQFVKKFEFIGTITDYFLTDIKFEFVKLVTFELFITYSSSNNISTFQSEIFSSLLYEFRNFPEIALKNRIFGQLLDHCVKVQEVCFE